jgi:putative transposase
VPRHPRIELVGATYHVTGRGVDRCRIFKDDIDREEFIRRLGISVTRFDWSVLGYCLMGSHYHLFVCLREPTLSRGIQVLNGGYAQAFNRRHGRIGHLFQGRFHAVLAEGDGHLFELLRYGALNPCRAGLCEVPEAWPWSSYGSAIGLVPADPILDEEALLRLFADDRSAARSRFRAYVEDADLRTRRGQTRVRPR